MRSRQVNVNRSDANRVRGKAMPTLVRMEDANFGLQEHMGKDPGCLCATENTDESLDL